MRRGFPFPIQVPFFAIILALALSQAEFRQQPKVHYVALFVFGDSLYDPGNNNFRNVSVSLRANYPPYGETFFKFPTGRFCDGRNVPDFFAMKANLPLWKPYWGPGKHQFLYGANFADAGAPVIAANVPSAFSFEKQLSFFKKVTRLLREQLGDVETKKLLTNAVCISSIGGVDYISYNKEDYPNVAHAEYVQWVIGNITDVIKEIYRIGGRKFAFQNVGPVGCMPSQRKTYNLSSHECVQEKLALAILHNNALSNTCKELESQLPGFKYSIFDYYNSLLDRMKDPSKYGFKVGDVACCGEGLYRGSGCGLGKYDLCSNPNQYLFFDGSHPTEHGCSQLAELFWSGELNVTGPLNMKQLVELEPEPEIFVGDDGPLILTNTKSVLVAAH